MPDDDEQPDTPLPEIPDVTLQPPFQGFFDPQFGGLPVGAATAGASGAAPGGIDPRARTALNILALLLGVGGLAGAGQELFGGPSVTTVSPRFSPQQSQLIGGAQQQFGQTGNLLQSLQGMLQNPQIPPGLSLLAEQAFRPQLGNLFSQATEAGRRRGFQDAPATSPPGGAILGPGLADLQGQIAQAKLNLYQNNIQNLLNTMQGSQRLGQGQGGLAAALPTARQEQVPRPSLLQVLGGLGPILGGIGGILGAANPAPSAPSGGGGLLSTLSGLFQ